MLKINQFELTYPGQAVLATVTWSIIAGTQIALLGRSGVGKSTLLRAILTNQDPCIQVLTERIAYMSQQPALIPWRTVVDNLMLGPILRGERPNSSDTDRAQQLLQRVGLSGLANRRTNTLSGGQKARVALGRALFENAELVLLDEPFASLDRSTRIQMADLCGDLLAHKTVLLVTHDPRDASDWLHHTMVLTERELKGPYDLDEFSNDRALIEALEGDL